MLACQVREDMVRTLPPTCDSAVLPCVHGSLAFLHRHIPPQSPSHPLHPSLHSRQQPSPCNCSTIPKLQLPATAPSRGPASLSGVYMAAARTVWFSFHLGCHRSAVSLSALNVSPLTQTVAPVWGLDPCFSSPLPWAGPVPLTVLFFPLVPSSYRALCGSDILFHWSGTPVCSQLVFCMHFSVWRCISDLLWKEMYSASTYSSAILF